VAINEFLETTLTLAYKKFLYNAQLIYSVVSELSVSRFIKTFLGTVNALKTGAR